MKSIISESTSLMEKHNQSKSSDEPVVKTTLKEIVETASSIDTLFF